MDSTKTGFSCQEKTDQIDALRIVCEINGHGKVGWNSYGYYCLNCGTELSVKSGLMDIQRAVGAIQAVEAIMISDSITKLYAKNSVVGKKGKK